MTQQYKLRLKIKILAGFITQLANKILLQLKQLPDINTTVRILSSMLACIPLSYVIPMIPHARVREIYSFLLGTLVQFYIYGTDIYLVFLMHALVYFMVRANPDHCGKNVTIIALALLSVYHIYRMVVDYGGWTMDISTIIMSNVNKYSLFAYSVQDGKAHLNKLSKQQIKQKIDTMPSFFRFVSYCQFLPCSPISLAFPFKYYEDYIGLKSQYAKIPSPWKMVGKDLAYAGANLALYLIHMFVFPLSNMQNYQFAEKGFWYIILYSFLCVTTLRFKYYFAWKLAMGAVHASGVSYQVHANDTSDFKLIQTCNPVIVQTTVHTREKIANWNMTCQQWLRKCVYQRHHFKNKMHGQLLTFMVSAFWHGYYGGYYISFFLWFCQLYVSGIVFKQSKKEKSPFVKIYRMAGPLGKIAVWIASNVAFSVSGAFFQVLSLKLSLAILKSIYFTPFIFYFLVYLVFTVGGTREKRTKDEGHHGEKAKNPQLKLHHEPKSEAPPIVHKSQ